MSAPGERLRIETTSRSWRRDGSPVLWAGAESRAAFAEWAAEVETRAARPALDELVAWMRFRHGRKGS
jgi:hypothetical protein